MKKHSMGAGCSGNVENAEIFVIGCTVYAAAFTSHMV